MGKAVAEPDEFAAAMQQLSAEAEKTRPPDELESHAHVGWKDSLDRLLQEFSALNDRIKTVENALSKRLDQLAAAMPQAKQVDLPARFEKIDEQLTAIRSSESVNQRLFDALHEELHKYRDNFLHESLQQPFIHDLVLLFDHLNSLAEQMGTAANEKGKRTHLARWRDNLKNAIHSLVEILHRFEVKEIEPKEHVDRALHRVVSYEPADYPEEDGRIVIRVRPGFCWRGEVIRPEEVIAKRFN